MMKHFISLLLIISLVGVGIFGFAVFNHDMHGSDNGCAVFTINGTACPTSIMAMILHHFSVLQTFSLILVPLLLVIISIFLSSKNFFFPKLTFLPHRFRNPANLYRQQKIVSWLSLKTATF